jgi:hypothetical protein
MRMEHMGIDFPYLFFKFKKQLQGIEEFLFRKLVDGYRQFYKTFHPARRFLRD